MRLNEIRDNPGATRPRKRIGRGIGSGTGKTSARGHKGQKSRAGGGVRPGFEGGQMPLYRRLPKRGFKNPFAKHYAVLNLGRLQQAVDAGRLDASGTIDEAALRKAGLFKRLRDGVRILGKGQIKVPIMIEVTGASQSAVAAVEKAGGRLTVLGHRKSVPAGVAESVSADEAPSATKD